MSIEAALIHEQYVDRMVQQVTHVASNGIWDPNKLANPPVQTITTTGTGIGDYPSHWYQPVYPSITIEPVVVPFIQTVPFIQPQPVTPWPLVPSPAQEAQHYQELMRQMQERFQQQQMKLVLPQEEPEEEAKPVEKKYGRKLEP